MELFSFLLAGGIRSLHRRGFENGYIEAEEVTTAIRGRVLIPASLKSSSRMAHQQVVCLRDELTTSVIRNRILKTTIQKLLDHDLSSTDLRRQLLDALALIRQFESIAITKRLFHVANSQNTNRLYAFLLKVCQFVYESLQPFDNQGSTRLVSVLREPARMRRIFEKFVRNF